MQTTNLKLANLVGSNTKNLAIVLAGILAITVGAKIQVPFWPVPMTLQTLAIFLTAASLGLRLGLASIVGYLVLGFIGFPVFAGAAAGPLYMAGPTAGFLIGFIAMFIIIGAAQDFGWLKGPVRALIVFIAADSVCFALGFLWLSFGFALPSTGSAMGVSAAFSAGVLPFVLGDMLKAVIAAVALTLFENWSNRAEAE